MARVVVGLAGALVAVASVAWLTAGQVSSARAQEAEAPANAAEGETPQQVVEQLNANAMEAYNALDINAAGSMLEQALQVAYDNGITGPLLARSNLNLGVVYIGGLGDKDSALSYFVQALCADPGVQLDPLTSSPDIQEVFDVAKQQVEAGACEQAAAAPTPEQAAAAAAPPPPPPDQVFMHVPPAEQLSQTPLPIYVEVNPLARAKSVHLYYKGLGMEQFKRVPMYLYGNGLAYQISCNDIWEPSVAYYIEAHDEEGNVVGNVGSAQTPYEVPVVASRTHAEPALPGAAAPVSCAAQECPPGLKGCVQRGKAGIDESCGEDTDCQSGLECRSDQCVLIGAGGTEVPDYDPATGGFEEGGQSEPDDPSEFKRTFVQAGLVVGMGYVTNGMLADRPAPDNRVYVDQFGNWVEDPISFVNSGGQVFFPQRTTPTQLTAWVPDADSEDITGVLDRADENCSADGTFTGPRDFTETGDPDALFPSKYCVRIKSPGFVPSLALRAAVGHFITDRISVAAIFRLAFSGGEGTMANMLLGARGEYMLTSPRSKGLMISLFGGGTFGQIQVQPPADGDTDGAPFIKSGLMGVHAGTTVRYRFSKNFGVYAAPEFDFQLPTFLFNLDLTIAGVEAAF
jgi:hypothetical protein